MNLNDPRLSDWPLHGGCFPAIIEIQAGSKLKYEFDQSLGLLRLSRVLHSAVRYPANYGFVPGTLGADGDPLDVLVLCQEPIQPLAIVDVRALGGVELSDRKGMDDKIICVPMGDPFYKGVTKIKQLPKHVVREIVRFFKDYKVLEGKKVNVGSVFSAKHARQVVHDSVMNYRKNVVRR